MFTSRLLLAALLATNSAYASPLQNQYAYALKSAHPTPNSFTKVGPAPADHVINLEIGLKQAYFDELERQLYDSNYDLSRLDVFLLILASIRPG